MCAFEASDLHLPRDFFGDYFLKPRPNNLVFKDNLPLQQKYTKGGGGEIGDKAIILQKKKEKSFFLCFLFDVLLCQMHIFGLSTEKVYTTAVRL